MTAKEFNEKYKDYLEEGHYGAEGFDEPNFLDWLDNKFEVFITYPNFKFTQIKVKFGMGRFYADNIPQEMINEVETEITKTNKQ